MKAKMILGAAALSLSLSGCSVFKGKDGPKTPTVGKRVAVLGGEEELIVDPQLAATPVAVPAPQVNADWAQPGGSSGKIGGHPALGSAIAPAWSARLADAGSTLATGPVVSGGKLFAIDTSATVYAFDAETGAAVWRVQIPSTVRAAAATRFGGGVSVEGNRVYATSGLGDIVALNAATGAVVWSKHPAGPLRGAPTLFGGNVYAMTQDNQIIALRAADGEQQWQESASVEPGSIFGAAAPAADQGTIVAGFSSGELNAYRYENGRNLWGDVLSRTGVVTSVSTLADVDASPVIDNGKVYAIGQGGRMAAYDLLSGQRIWELGIAGISTPWLAGDWLFVVTDQAKLAAIARASGKVRWVSDLPLYLNAEKKKDRIRWSGPILAGGRLFLVSSKGAMLQVNPADGKILGQSSVGEGMTKAPIVANNTLYTLDNSGRISAWR